jgi:hypothetical protein
MRFLYTFILVIGLIQIEIKFILYIVIKAKGCSYSCTTIATASRAGTRILLFLALSFPFPLALGMARVSSVWVMGVVRVFIPAFMQAIVFTGSARTTDSHRFAVNYYNLPCSAAGCFFRG